MKPHKPTRDPDKVTQKDLLPFGVTLRRITIWTDAGEVNDIELTCDRCGDIWIPCRFDTQFGYLRIIKLGSQLSHRYWVCLNGCNSNVGNDRRKGNTKGKGQERIFKAVAIGRAIELAESIIGDDPQDGQIEALLELLAGVTDEAGCPTRHNAAASVMRHISNRQSNAWLDEIERLQSSTIAATANL